MRSLRASLLHVQAGRHSGMLVAIPALCHMVGSVRKNGQAPYPHQHHEGHACSLLDRNTMFAQCVQDRGLAGQRAHIDQDSGVADE